MEINVTYRQVPCWLKIYFSTIAATFTEGKTSIKINL